jgi:hypothetical protein
LRRDRLTRGGAVLLLALSVAAVLALRAAATGSVPPPNGEPPRGGEPGAALPASGPGDALPAGQPGDARNAGQPAAEKLHPTLADWLAHRPASRRERVVVTFRPEALLPESELQADHDARILERFWINNSALIDLPIGQIAALAARPDVAYVQPEEGGEPPPG